MRHSSHFEKDRHSSSTALFEVRSRGDRKTYTVRRRFWTKACGRVMEEAGTQACEVIILSDRST